MKQQISLDELEAKINSVFASPSYKPRISSLDAAKFLGVSLRTLRRWERAGLTPERDDPTYYRRQYVKDDIEAFAKARREARLNSNTKSRNAGDVD